MPGCLYQVIDLVITTAEPTEDLDAITVGMVCVRNLQVGLNERINITQHTVVMCPVITHPHSITV